MTLHSVKILNLRDGFPVETCFGVTYAKSKRGSRVKFNVFIDPAFRHHIMDEPEGQLIIDVDFQHLERMDKAFFLRSQDYQMYDLDQYHLLLTDLDRSKEWVLYTIEN